MPYAGHVTNSIKLSSVAKTAEDGGWKIEDHHPQSSTLHLLISLGSADHRADTDNAEKQLVDGNLLRRSDLAKRA